MKSVTQLVDFLFHSSKEQDGLMLAEEGRLFLEELSAAVPVKVMDKKPLVAALKKAGIDGLGDHLKSDASGLHAEFDNSAEYNAFVSQLLDGGKLYDLASYGWVATYSDDVAPLGDTPRFRVNFLDIGEVEPKNSDANAHTGEDDDIQAMDREAVAAYKEVNDLSGQKDSLRKKDETATYTESQGSRRVIDSLTNAAETVEKLLEREESGSKDNQVTCPKCHTGHVKQHGYGEFECLDCGHKFKKN